MRYFILLVLGLLLTASWALGQKSDPKMEAIKLHYNSLEADTKAFREAVQKENEAYRKFIQEERAEYQKFLERTITTGGMLISLVIGLLTFFGISTFRGINESRKEIETVATNQLLEYSKALNESQNRLQNAQQNMRDLEKSYQEHINFYRNANPKNGRYLFIGTTEKLEQMTQNELVRFIQVFGETEKLSSEDFENEKFYPVGYDVVVYRSNVDANGEDPVLVKLTNQMEMYSMIPIVVYAKDKSEWLNNTTQNIFNARPLNHLANNQISLIDNVASAFRVSKLLSKPKTG